MERLTGNSALSGISGHKSEPIRGPSTGEFPDPKYCVPEQSQENYFQKVLKWLRENEKYMKPTDGTPYTKPRGI